MSNHVPPVIGNWYLNRMLGSGFSGSIWAATNPYTSKEAAIKIQHADTDCPTNRYERNFYPSLQGGVGMPTLWAAGVQDVYDYLVIDLLGPSLDSLYRKNNQQVMDVRSVICIAMQVLSRLEFMHARGILHRDIQLGNCVVGLPPNGHIIYMIDFGFSKRYIDPVTRRHIPDSKVKRDFIGNYWFSSVNVHCRGKVPSRRDDLEALALMLIHLLTPGGLPWTRKGVPKNSVAQDRVIREKRDARPEELCRHLPEEFESFLRYCRRLKFAEQPDYAHWREEFAELARTIGYADERGVVDDAFHWPPLPEPVRAPERQPLATLTRPLQPQVKAKVSSDIMKLLEDIAKMDLRELQQQQLQPAALDPDVNKCTDPSNESDKENAVVNGDVATKEKAPTKEEPIQTVIVISSDSEGEDEVPLRPSRRKAQPLETRTAKATILLRLTDTLRSSSNNADLARAVRQFTEALQGSRIVTKEGFAFLDALEQRLAVPGKASKTRSATRREQTEAQHSFPRADMARLCSKLIVAPRGLLRTEMAGMVTEFGATVKRTSGRVLNKDGFAFLRALEKQLIECVS